MRRHSICLYTCFQDATHLKAIVVKAESLYSTCQVWYIMPPPNTHTHPLFKFEHALALFLRGIRLAPDSTIMVMGITKCRKAILSKVQEQFLFKWPMAISFFLYCQQVSEKDVFFFPGSKNFIDFLRADGGVSKFCSTEVAAKKGFHGFATRSASPVALYYSYII